MKRTTQRQHELKDFEPPTLDGLLAFELFPDESNPNEAGPLHVTIDPREITLRWLGDRAVGWRGTWTDLRELLESHKAAESNLRFAREELEMARELREEAQRERDRVVGEARILPFRPPAEES